MAYREIGPCSKCGNIRDLTGYKGKKVCLSCWLQLTEVSVEEKKCLGCGGPLERVYESNILSPSKATFEDRCFGCEPYGFSVDDEVVVEYFRNRDQGVNEDARNVRVIHAMTGIFVDSASDVSRRENLALAMRKLDEKVSRLGAKKENGWTRKGR